MVTKKVIPISRIHNPLALELEIEGGQIVTAKSSGVLYRGFEQMLIGRDPRDAIWLTQRICGICS